MSIDLTDFLGDVVVSREITHKGNTRTFHFRELSAGEAEDLFLGTAEDGKIKKGTRAKIIAAIWCDEAGEPAATAADVAKLPNSLAQKLQDIALEVNQGEKAEVEKN